MSYKPSIDVNEGAITYLVNHCKPNQLAKTTPVLRPGETVEDCEHNFYELMTRLGEIDAKHNVCACLLKPADVGFEEDDQPTERVSR